MPKVCILDSTTNKVVNVVEVDDVNNVPDFIVQEGQVLASNHDAEIGDTWTGTEYDITHRLQIFTDEDLWEYNRWKRDELLKESDWTASSDNSLSDDKKAEWATYRQALRDVPQTHTEPRDITWPTKPE